MFKWTVSQAVISKASIQKIWNLWTNIEGWSLWDSELEWSKLEGNLKLHAHGSLKPKGMAVYRFEITELTPGKSFTTKTSLFLSKMVDVHTLKNLDSSKIEIKQTVTVSGLLAPFLYFVMRKNLQKGLTTSLQKLSTTAEQ